MAMTNNVAQRLTVVTGIGVSLGDYSRWTSGYKNTDTEKAINKLFGKPYKPSLSELMYCMLLAPRMMGTPSPEVEAVRTKVTSIFDNLKANKNNDNDNDTDTD